MNSVYELLLLEQDIFVLFWNLGTLLASLETLSAIRQNEPDISFVSWTLISFTLELSTQMYTFLMSQGLLCLFSILYSSRKQQHIKGSH